MLWRGAQSEAGELCARLRPRDPGCKPTEDSQIWPFTNLILHGIRAERDPIAVTDRESKTFGHDADDGVHDAPEFHRPTDDGRVALEPRLPDVVPDDNHWGRVGP